MYSIKTEIWSDEMLSHNKKELDRMGETIRSVIFHDDSS